MSSALDLLPNDIDHCENLLNKKGNNHGDERK